MSKYLRKFETEAEYSAATLYYPSVAWVTDTDTVHFDKTAPTPPTPSLEFIPFDTRMEQYQDKYIKRIVIGDSSTYSGVTFEMGYNGGVAGGSYLRFSDDGSSVTAYGDFVVDGVTNLTLPIDITPVNPVQLTSNNWGKTNVISWWPYEAEIYNGFSDLHIEWQN